MGTIFSALSFQYFIFMWQDNKMEETLEKEIPLSEVKDSDEGTVWLLNQNF